MRIETHPEIAVFSRVSACSPGRSGHGDRTTPLPNRTTSPRGF